MSIQSKAEYRMYLRADLAAHGFSHWRWWMRFKYDIMTWQRLLRKTEYRINCRPGVLWRPFVLWTRWRYRQRSIRLGFEIPPNVFGPGLVVMHWGGIVVNPRARVGANCRIHAGASIGEEKDEVPILGDNVYIGPGAKIFGDIRLGNNVRIGANAVVNKSWPDGVTLVGIPARPVGGGPLPATDTSGA
jgi:serine O-acetyltransferase